MSISCEFGFLHCGNLAPLEQGYFLSGYWVLCSILEHTAYLRITPFRYVQEERTLARLLDEEKVFTNIRT